MKIACQARWSHQITIKYNLHLTRSSGRCGTWRGATSALFSWTISRYAPYMDTRRNAQLFPKGRVTADMQPTAAVETRSFRHSDSSVKISVCGQEG